MSGKEKVQTETFNDEIEGSDIEGISCELNVVSLSMGERIRVIGENSWHFERSGVNSISPDIDIVPSYNAGTRNEGSGKNASLCQAGKNSCLIGERSGENSRTKLNRGDFKTHLFQEKLKSANVLPTNAKMLEQGKDPIFRSPIYPGHC